MSHDFLWIDAYTRTPFAGNPCAVVFDADAVPVDTRLAFTRETRLSECAFLQKSATADFGVRYYVASGEIKMAGHPTVATVTALLERGLVAAPSQFRLEVGAGVIDIELGSDGLVTFTSPKPTFRSQRNPAEIAALVGLTADDIVGEPQTVDVGGPGFCITLVRDHAALRRAVLDIEGLYAARDSGADFSEAFLACLTGATQAGDTFSRLLLAPPEPAEDPFTGSATACLGAYLWRHHLIERPLFTAEQGHWMGRPGSADVEIVGTPEAITGVRVGGHGAVVMEGRVRL
ncbi:MAG: PhzF family phenazine biosynthesis protein [Pseudomonadota bacterium]